jgi:dephospho-CoA kinase
LTGGIGSGKSAVADGFASLGAGIIDSDAIARALTGPGGEALGAIDSAFGAQFIGADGALDRARMRDLVFHDASAKARLEGILHPLIRARTADEAARLVGRTPYLVLVVPLLVESGSWQKRVDRLLVVDCTTATQEARVAARSGIGAALARSIIAQQASRGARLDAADDILVNEGTFADLAQRIARLHRRYSLLASGVGERL